MSLIDNIKECAEGAIDSALGEDFNGTLTEEDYSEESTQLATVLAKRVVRNMARRLDIELKDDYPNANY